MRKLPTITFDKILLVSAAVVQGFQYADAFGYIHSRIAGFIAGFVIVGAVAFGGSRLPRISSKRARKTAWVLFIIILVISPFILTATNWYSMDNDFKKSIGFYAWVLSALVATIPELALALVAFSVEGGLLKQPKKQTEQSRSTRKATLSKSKAEESKTFLAECPLNCGWSKNGYTTKQASQMAINGHMVKHRKETIQVN